MAGQTSYEELKRRYKDFSYPAVEIVINGKPFSKNSYGFIVGEFRAELTCGMEASQLVFRIYNCYLDGVGFDTENLSRLVELGAKVTAGIGYLETLKEVFQGFVAGLEYGWEDGKSPWLEVTALDVKGAMMANAWSRQLGATTFDAAVREILGKPAYAALVEMQEIGITPDQGEPAAMEMNAESDYEFVVRAAKKCNFEFFTDCGTVKFRKAKQDTSVLLELEPGRGMERFRIEYGLMGLVEQIEVRAPDTATGKLISAKGKRSGKLSNGSRAAAVLKKSKKTCIDPTAISSKAASARLDYLMEDMMYRFGTLETETVGIPELKPGRFLEIGGMGDGVSNRFYLTTVVHEITEESGYRTRITGRAPKLWEKGSM